MLYDPNIVTGFPVLYVMCHCSVQKVDAQIPKTLLLFVPAMTFLR